MRKSRADEEQALEGEVGAPRPVGAAACEAMAAVIVRPGSSGSVVNSDAAGRAGGDEHDHRLADGPGDGEDERGHEAGDRGRDRPPGPTVVILRAPIP